MARSWPSWAKLESRTVVGLEHTSRRRGRARGWLDSSAPVTPKTTGSSGCDGERSEADSPLGYPEWRV
ncbi:hypothetical protein BC567DRAFT_235121 [Phyllosticta citribraziliensis]